MKVTESDNVEITRRDPVVNTFKIFSRLHDVAVSGSVVVAPEDAYAQTVTAQAATQESDFVLILPVWGKTHYEFVQGVLSSAVCNVGVFISNGVFSGDIGSGLEKTEVGDLSRTISGYSLRSHGEAAQPPVADKSHHVFLPFVGGADDRAALRFMLQLARSPHVTDSSTLATVRGSIPAKLIERIDFIEVTVSSSTAVESALRLAREAVGQNSHNAGDIIVVGRRHPRLKRHHTSPASSSKATTTTIDFGGGGASNSTTTPNNAPENQDLGKTVGLLGEKMALGGLKASVLVIQAMPGPGLDSSNIYM
ncbi:K+ homeostasis protein Kha1 [Apiospora sp. TS-2023a]